LFEVAVRVSGECCQQDVLNQPSCLVQFHMQHSDSLPSAMADKHTRATSESYDRVADEYPRRIYHELEAKPFDREILRYFADAVRGRGVVCDMGCGPGHVANFPQSLGTNVFGLDISRGMVEQARRLNPGVVFDVGDILSLDLSDGRLAGIVAFYAIVNITSQRIPRIFRVLQAGGLLLLAFHIGDEAPHYDKLWGRPVSLDFFYFQPSEIRHLLEAAGFTIEEIVEREPYAPDVEHQSRRAYIADKKNL
jgi:SAM-dependent methyltransferase